MESSNNKTEMFFSQIPETISVVDIACTRYNTFVHTKTGYIYSFGSSTYALGRIVTTPDEARRPGVIKQFIETGAIYISAGLNHVLALDNLKNLWVWGENKYGQLGIGSLKSCIEPVKVSEVRNIVRIRAGDDFSMCICYTDESAKRRSGYSYRQYVWGNNTAYKLLKFRDKFTGKRVKYIVSPYEITNML